MGSGLFGLFGFLAVPLGLDPRAMDLRSHPSHFDEDREMFLMKIRLTVLEKS